MVHYTHKKQASEARPTSRPHSSSSSHLRPLPRKLGSLVSLPTLDLLHPRALLSPTAPKS